MVYTEGNAQDLTPLEFEGENAKPNYLARIASPLDTDWMGAGRPYYDHVNYSKLLVDGRTALINACAYRNPIISEEPDNKKKLKHLTSVKFTRSWLLECVIPLAEAKERFVMANWLELAEVIKQKAEPLEAMSLQLIGPRFSYQLLNERVTGC